MNALRNTVQLIGNLGNDPQLRKSTTGNNVISFTLATHEVRKKENGEKSVTTEWHNCVAFGKTAETMEVLLKKGKEVAVQGKLTHRSYEDKSGQKRYFTEVVVRDFMLVN